MIDSCDTLFGQIMQQCPSAFEFNERFLVVNNLINHPLPHHELWITIFALPPRAWWSTLILECLGLSSPTVRGNRDRQVKYEQRPSLLDNPMVSNHFSDIWGQGLRAHERCYAHCVVLDLGCHGECCREELLQWPLWPWCLSRVSVWPLTPLATHYNDNNIMVNCCCHDYWTGSICTLKFNVFEHLLWSWITSDLSS